MNTQGFQSGAQALSVSEPVTQARVAMRARGWHDAATAHMCVLRRRGDEGLNGLLV